MKKVSTGIIYRLFKDEDKDTIIRKTNIRTFCQQKNLDYIISQGKMLVDMKDFLNSLNPKHFKASKTFPKLRTKISAQNEWTLTIEQKSNTT